jgi:hypothetical protein
MKILNERVRALTWGTNELSQCGRYLINHAFQFTLSTEVAAHHPHYRTFTSLDKVALFDHIQRKLSHGKLSMSGGWDMAQFEITRVLSKLVPEEKWTEFRRALVEESRGFKKAADVEALLRIHGGQYRLHVAKFGAADIRAISTPEQRVADFLAKLPEDKRKQYICQPLPGLTRRAK